MKRRDLPDGTRFRWTCEHARGLDAARINTAGDRNDGPGQAECTVDLVEPEQIVAHAFALLIEAVCP